MSNKPQRPLVKYPEEMDPFIQFIGYRMDPYSERDLSLTRLVLEEIPQTTGATGFYYGCKNINRLSIINEGIFVIAVQEHYPSSSENLTEITKKQIARNYLNTWIQQFEEAFNTTTYNSQILTSSRRHELEDSLKESLFENFELKLTEQEAESLINRLKEGPTKKAKKFIKKSIKF